MLRGLYTAYTGMQAQQQRLDTVSNNLANVNTTAFKKDRAIFESFHDVYVRKINDPTQVGSQRIGRFTPGVRMGESFVDHTQGSIIQTDAANQLAIQGDGFFAVERPMADGTMNTYYTRDGSFILSPEGMLMTTDGDYLLGENGPITVDDLSSLRIDTTGTVMIAETVVDQIQMVAFEDVRQLDKLGLGLYVAPEGAEMLPFNGSVLQGFLEGSNVNSIDEMVNMINVMRTYESNQKVLQTYDSTLDLAVNQVGRL